MLCVCLAFKIVFDNKNQDFFSVPLSAHNDKQ